jgi:hypothetical protein
MKRSPSTLVLRSRAATTDDHASPPGEVEEYGVKNDVFALDHALQVCHSALEVAQKSSTAEPSPSSLTKCCMHRPPAPCKPSRPLRLLRIHHMVLHTIEVRQGNIHRLRATHTGGPNRDR